MKCRAEMLSRLDQAKYPFTKDAGEHVRTLGITVEELASPEYNTVLERALKKLETALTTSKISEDTGDEEVEILAFPAASYLVSALGDDRARRRYALAEAKRAYELLRKEPVEKIAQIAGDTFGWRIKPERKQVRGAWYDFEIYFADYLRNIRHMRETSWKLVNRNLVNGFVLATKEDAARLLAEEVQRRILDKTKVSSLSIAEQLKPWVERVRKAALAGRVATQEFEMPKQSVPEAMPPCIINLYNNLLAGKNLPHKGRFTLTSFMVNSGGTPEDVINLFKSAPDYNERITRYQVQHIAGEKGRKKKYTPPKCNTLKTHGICFHPDELCQQISHPLGYYRRKLSLLRQKSRLRVPAVKQAA